MKNQSSTEVRDTAAFNDVLDAAGKLTLEEQEALIDILNRRLVSCRRSLLAKDTQDAQQELQRGACRPATPEELIKEILS